MAGFRLINANGSNFFNKRSLPDRSFLDARCAMPSDDRWIDFLESIDRCSSIARSPIADYRFRRVSTPPPPPRSLPAPRCCGRRRRAAGPPWRPRRSCRAARPRASRSHPGRSSASACPSRDRREVAVADFDRHGARDQAVVLQPLGVVARHAGDLLAHPIEVREVVRVRALARRRLRRPVRLDRAIVVAVRELAASQSARLPTAARSTAGSAVRTSHERVDAALAQPLRGDRARRPTARRPAVAGGTTRRARARSR